ncbi:MAG: DMT family transporter [Pseudomonadota bacterium]
MPLNIATVAGLAIALSAGVWGLFWVPLYAIQATGVRELWASAMFLLTPAPVAFLAAHRFGRDIRANRETWLLGSACGVSVVLYTLGLLTSDVVRVTYLFYLMPIWTSLLALIFLGETLSNIRRFAIVGALVGLVCLLGFEEGIPWPRGLGDWCGLAAGVIWAGCLVTLRGEAEIDPWRATFCMLLVGGLFALCLAIALPEQRALVPSFTAIGRALPLAAVVGIAVFWPTSVAMLWGARFVFASTAALLTMSELIVATASATWALGTSIGIVGWIGAGLIAFCVTLDLGSQRRKQVDNAPSDVSAGSETLDAHVSQRERS